MSSPERPSPVTGTYEERPRVPPQASRGPNEATRAQRIAGALLLINSAFLLAETVFIKQPIGKPSALTSPTTWIVPAIIDIVIGAALLKGTRAVVPLAILRCFGGVILGSVIHISQQNPFGAVLQVILCASLVALLIGDAGQLRTGFAIGGAALVWLFEIAGISALTTGRNPLGGLVATFTGGLEAGPVKLLTGVKDAYTLEMPNDKWRLRKAEAARKDNPIADRWIMRPDLDAHVIVIAERVPGGVIPIESFTDTIIGNATRTMKDFKATSRETWPAYPRTGRLLRGSGTGEGVELNYMYGLVTGYERAFQVVGFASQRAPAEAMEDIAKIIDSLKLPPDMSFIPQDVEKEPAGKVTGVSVAYTVDTPNTEWLRRKADVVRKDNPIADVWLVRPDLDAHVLIVAEHEPGATIPIEAYTDAILENARKVTEDLQVIETKEWRAAPESGRFLHTKSKMRGQEFEHYYGLITIGDRAFQITAFATKENFRKAGPELLGIIESFKLPADLKASPSPGAKAPGAL